MPLRNAGAKISRGNHWILAVAIVLSLLSTSVKADALITNGKALDSRARSLATALGSQLKGELIEAINSAGFEAAISVCAERAPSIAAKLSVKNGATVGRVSSRPRNASNTPLAWQQDWLKAFASRRLNNEPVQQLERSDINKSAGDYRFMKAIAADALCLACHGKNIEPSIQAAIRNRYPADQAYGYELGDLRGAFVVTFPLENPSHGSYQYTSNAELVK